MDRSLVKYALADLNYWTNVAPTVDWRCWSQARDAATAGRIRIERIAEAKAYLKYLLSAARQERAAA